MTADLLTNEHCPNTGKQYISADVALKGRDLYVRANRSGDTIYLTTAPLMEADEVVEDIVRLSDDEWRVSGGASLDDLRELFPISDEFESVTVNGWVLEVLGHLPQPGDAFDYGNLHVTVERVARRRVEQVRIHHRVQGR